MIELNYLTKLLDGDSVEWMSLGDIAEYSTTRVDAIKLDSTSFTGVDNLISNKGGRIDANYLPNTARLTAYEPGDILLGNIRPYLKKVWMATDSGGCSGDVLAVRIRYECRSFVNPNFLYFILSSDAFFSYSMQHAKGAKMPRGSKADILNYEIPIPCPSNPEKSFAIQSEIVRILDKFTALTAELNAELTMRKKQYNYYRDQLLSFEEDEIELKALDDVCALISAGGDVPENSIKGQVKPTNEHPYPIYANATDEKGLYGYTDSYKIDSDAVTISARGAKVGYHTVRDAKFTPIIRLIVLVADKNLVRTRYLNYVLDMTAIGGTDGGIPQLTVPMVKKITVPIPFASDPNRSLAEQDRIVAILDKFDTLTNSISEGLPREIELRQKQYEYYRNLLFSFPKSNIKEGA